MKIINICPHMLLAQSDVLTDLPQASEVGFALIGSNASPDTYGRISAHRAAGHNG